MRHLPMGLIRTRERAGETWRFSATIRRCVLSVSFLGVFKGGETGAWEDMHRFTTPRLAVNVKVRVPSPFGVLCYWKEINTFHTGRSEGH